MSNVYYAISILIIILNYINKNKKSHITGNNTASIEVSIKLKWLSLTFKKNNTK